MLRAAAACAIALAGLSPAAFSATAAAADPVEETRSIAVTVKDLHGREETRQIPVTIFRPDDGGRHPLVVMNHGRAAAENRAAQSAQRYEGFARHLVSRGFVVMLPTRVGYGPTYGDFDPESTGACAAMRLEPQAQAASDQVLATLAYARTLPYVDASRWLVAGQSVGGLTAVATVWRHPPGLVGGINFSGGTGGDPHRSPGRPCHPERIEALWRARAAEAVAPMLWLYWENDEYWGAENPRRWHAAWLAGGGKAEFHVLAPVRKTGHGGIGFDAEHWQPLVDNFLDRIGFEAPAPPAGAPEHRTP